MQDGKLYELGYLLSPLLPEDKVKEELATIKAGILARSGEMVAEGEPRMRYLAYTVVKKISNKNVRFNDAHIGWMRFNLPAGEAPALTEMLNKNDHIVRFLLITIPNIKEQEALEVEDVAGSETKEGISEQEIDREIDSLIGSANSKETAVSA